MPTTVRDERGMTLPQRKALRRLAHEGGFSVDMHTGMRKSLVKLGLAEWWGRWNVRLTDEGVLVAALLMLANPLGEPEPSMADKRAEFLRDWGQPVGANVGGPLGILPAPVDVVPVLDDEP